MYRNFNISKCDLQFVKIYYASINIRENKYKMGLSDNILVFIAFFNAYGYN